MELIVIAFAGVFLTLLGHTSLVIAQSLLRRARVVRALAETPEAPPPGKRLAEQAIESASMLKPRSVSCPQRNVALELG